MIASTHIIYIIYCQVGYYLFVIMTCCAYFIEVHLLSSDFVLQSMLVRTVQCLMVCMSFVNSRLEDPSVSLLCMCANLIPYKMKIWRGIILAVW